MDYIINTTFLGDSFYYDLVKGRFIKNDKDNKVSLSITPKNIIENSSFIKEHSDFMCITIAITDACNLRCTYCFEIHGKRFLKTECITNISKLIQAYKRKMPHVSRVVVIWFGGEPILNLNFILESSNHIKKTCDELFLHYSARVITNGVELDKLIPYINELNITDIQITLDGPKEVHDARRVNANGIGSFERIISNVQQINTEVDLIIRTNVDKENILKCGELYDYILEMPVYEGINLYFQPMLVENYGGESTCYEGLILNDEELNETFLDLLEYTNSLEEPKYIGAFCNVDFPGSIVVRPDESLCKCWAEVATSSSSLRIQDNVETVLNFMNIKARENKLECEKCIIFPTCLGGCKYKPYKEDECRIKRKRVLSTIWRIYFEKQVSVNMHFKILKNELIWLRSIGCKVRYINNGIEVSREDLQTEEFNFFIGMGNDSKCIRISQEVSELLANENTMLFNGYRKDLDYDINYIYINTNDKYIKRAYVFDEATVEEWADDCGMRQNNRYTKYYNILYEGNMIGKMSAIITDIIGIYDFEILKKYQHKGHGTNSLRAFAAQTNKNLFVQTWKDNLIAQRCYERVGFKKYELVYRYIKE